MKRFAILLFAVLSLGLTSGGADATPLGKASSNFDNARPDKIETAWGRLVADSLRVTAKTDLALVRASVLRKGELRAGAVGTDDVGVLLAFPDDEVVTMRVSGGQLRAALERAVQAYPTGSPAMLHLSGLTATFNAGAPTNHRVTRLSVRGNDVKDADSFSVAMPMSLAEGGAGYYNIWNGRSATRSGFTLSGAVAAYIKDQGTITPDTVGRLAPQ
jgi:2',3'-cyclic-nucleotide 2'-phosphodiesterase (5'-nucleotidase family)